MERYTKRENGGSAVIRGDSIYSDCGTPEGFRGDAIDRLAAYEDTGLEPEEIRKSDEMLRAFIEHNKNTEYPRTLDWLLRITKAEAEGRLLVLPCKVGDTVYVLTKEKTIKAYEIGGVIIDQNNIWADAKEIGFPYGGGLLNAMQFGIDVFLTRKEAEAALKQEVQ